MKDGRCRTGKLAEQVGELGDEGDADEGDTAARHELFHTLRLCARVVVTVTLEQIDCTPDTETGTESDNESLKNTNSRVKKFHNFYTAKRKSANAQTTDFDVRHSFQKFYLI